MATPLRQHRVTLLAYDSAAEILIAALQGAVRWADSVWVEQALVALFDVSPARAVFPRVLRRDLVWSLGQRNQFVEEAHRQPGGTVLNPTTGINFGYFIEEMNAIAEAEGAPSIGEWHVAQALVKQGGVTLTRLGVNSERLLKEVAELYGRLPASDDERAKTWCFCDTNVFIEGPYFQHVDWPRVLAAEHPVLVVSAPVLRELDRLKVDPSIRHRNRRARQVLPELLRIARAASPATATCVSRGGEIFIEAREPSAFPHGLDPEHMDDRVIAAAIEFRWRHAEAEVALVTTDATPMVRARAAGLDVRSLPDDFVQRRLPPEALVYGLEEASLVLGMNEARLLELAERGEVPHTREDGTVLFDKKVLAEWSANRSRAKLRPAQLENLG